MRHSILVLAMTFATFGQSFSLPALCAVKSDYQSQALTAYQRGDFSLAARDFEKAVALKPADQVLRYYLANSLVYSGQHAQALVQYQTACKLDGNGLVASYCRQAIAAYSGQKPNVPKQVDQAALVNQAQARLTNEAGNVGGAAYTEGMQSAEDINALGGNQAATIQENARQIIQAMETAHGAGSHYVQRHADAVQTEFANDEANAQTATAYAVARQEALANQKRADIQEAASGLISQFAPNAQGLSVSPVGTNLFVRNYAHQPRNK